MAASKNRRLRAQLGGTEPKAREGSQSHAVAPVEPPEAPSPPAIPLNAPAVVDTALTGQTEGSGAPPAVSGRAEREAAARRRLEAKPRDDMGFVIGAQKSLTQEQFKWLTHRLDAETDGDADTAANVDPIKRTLWMRDPDFRALYDTCQENKREATRLLGSQLLPKAMRTIDALLDDKSSKAQQVGLTMLLRMQGLLIDKKVTTSSDELAALMRELRQPYQPTIINPDTVIVRQSTSYDLSEEAE